MTDQYTLRTRLRSAHGEDVDFHHDGARLRVHFDADGHGSVAGRTRLDANTAATIRAVDPSGAMYVLTAAPVPPPPTPPPAPPSKPPTTKAAPKPSDPKGK